MFQYCSVRQQPLSMHSKWQVNWQIKINLMIYWTLSDFVIFVSTSTHTHTCTQRNSFDTAVENEKLFLIILLYIVVWWYKIILRIIGSSWILSDVHIYRPFHLLHHVFRCTSFCVLIKIYTRYIIVKNLIYSRHWLLGDYVSD